MVRILGSLVERAARLTPGNTQPVSVPELTNNPSSAAPAKTNNHDQEQTPEKALSQHDLFFTSRLAHMMYQEYVKRRVAPEELDSRRPLTVRQEKCCRFWRRGKATRR